MWWLGTWAPSQYPKRHLYERSCKVSKPRDWYFELLYHFEIWQAHWQHCCRSACQISERLDNSKYKFHGFETLRDLTERRLSGYWDRALFFTWTKSVVLPTGPLVTNSSQIQIKIPYFTFKKLCLKMWAKLCPFWLRVLWVNSLWPSDVIWCWRSKSTLVQLMTWCLAAPSHHLHQC